MGLMVAPFIEYSRSGIVESLTKVMLGAVVCIHGTASNINPFPISNCSGSSAACSVSQVQLLAHIFSR